MAESLHQNIHVSRGSLARGELNEPLPESGVQRRLARTSDQTRLFDQVLIGAERDVLHTVSVYTRTVR